MNTQQFEALSEEEKAVWLGHKLHLCSLDTQREGQEYHEWLLSPVGLDAIEQAMIARGWNICIAYEPMRKWYCRFDKVRGVESAFVFAPAKPEAIITAAAKALIEEEENAGS